MTQRDAALQGTITPEMKIVAEREYMNEEYVCHKVASGEMTILKNTIHAISPIAIGGGSTIKVNANIGTSPKHMDINEELEKLRAAVAAGTDTVMDLSLGAIINTVRRAIMDASPVPVGTVPIYQMGFEMSKAGRHISDMTIEDFLSVVRQQAEEGVDYMTVHAGVTRRAVDLYMQQGRLLNIISRGGSMLAGWILRNEKENPLYTHYDDILDILHEYDVTISIGDGMRPGAIADATDRAQIEELVTLGELTQRAWDKGVQVLVEGPGHIPLNQIEANIRLQKAVTNNAPFYILGPLPCDVGAGHDHLTGAIGGAWAAYFGADYLCYLTPAEHLRLPNVDDVREGVIGTKIAAHCADLARGNVRAWERNRAIAKARNELNWDKIISLCIDEQKARKMRTESEAANDSVCTMCGEFCSIETLNETLAELEKKFTSIAAL